MKNRLQFRDFIALPGALLLSMFSLAAQNDTSFNARFDPNVRSILVQPGGKIIRGGDSRLGRLNPDGSIDGGFDPGTDGQINAGAALTNGQFLVGGSFTTVGGLARTNLARLTVSGGVDAAFTNAANADVFAMAVQADGKVIIGGAFTNLAGQSRNYIGRLNADGSLDTTFNPNAGGIVRAVAVQPDGQILVGGAFVSMGGQPVNHLCRLNTNGTLEAGFAPTPNSDVHAIAVQADGKIIIGGLFWAVEDQAHESLARLNSNGTLDGSFNGSLRPGYLGDTDTIAIQADGKIIAGGKAIGWFGYPYFGRFNPDGTVDSNFVVNVPSGVHSIAVQRDGKILRATVDDLSRLTNSPATESLVNVATNISWLRGGSAPEVWRTTFESSTNMTNWVFLGAGTRIAGGWSINGISISLNAYVRARGFVAAGFGNASSWFVEAYAGKPVILNPPNSRTNSAGSTATFTVLADGSPTLTYRWRKNGVNLTNIGNVSGATNATLTLSNVLKADAASYLVVVSNNLGAITSAVAGLTVIDPFIVTPPADQYVNAGDNAQFSVTATGTPPLTFQWQLNGLPLEGQTNTACTLTNVQGADAGSLVRVVVTNSSGSVTSSVALLTVNAATVDALDPSPNYEVDSVVVQPDGKILMAGNFSLVGSQLQVGIARLNDDGTLDTNFTAGLNGIPFSPALQELALQTDGRILLAGSISYVNSTVRERIGRLNPDGSLDTGFNPGASAEIFAATTLPDGKLLFAGSFTNLAGQFCSRIGRLNGDGSLDTNFTSTADGTIYAIALQPDGKVVVGGSFTTLGGQSRTNLGRFDTNGAVDLMFAPDAIGTVKTLALLTNGNIAVGGDFTALAGQSRTNLGRLETNGVLDVGFNPAPNGPVETLAVQLDGRLLLGGTFTSVAERSRANIARLNTDGSADMTFNPGADNTVRCVTVQPDGKIIVTGLFNTLNGEPRSFIGRLNANAIATNTLTFNSTSITWQRTGAGPEAWKTTVDYTTNGSVWLQQDGVRTASGWQATGLNLNGTTTIRARGFVSGSTEGSSWYAENSAGPAAILTPPASRTNTPFTLATFTVTAVGQSPLAFQWLKNGVPLTDTANILGSQTGTLYVSNVLGGDTASYQVVVSNASFSVTSAVAVLTVLDPFLTVQPASQTNNAGDTVSLSVAAIGTTNFTWQWLKNGTNLADGVEIYGSQTPTLWLTNVTGSDAGNYTAVVTNIWGSTTSIVAKLAVIDPLLVTNPVSRLANRGDTVTFGVLVRGESELAYQWRKDGAPLTGGNSATLTLSNVQTTNAGGYDVVVTNSFGSVTSAVASLTVNIALPDLADLAINGDVDAMALQPDGKILLGGLFTSVAGQTRNRIARLNADGSLDAVFNPNARGNALAGVFSFAVQTDGKILVGGSFTNIGGVVCSNLARLNTNGSLDTTFIPNPTYFSPGNSRVMSLLLQPDGKIVLGGVFTTVAGQPCTNIGRLNMDGTLDTNFQATANGFVTTLTAQADGKILVSGSFGALNGQPRNGFGRINADGSLDNSLTNMPNGSVAAIVEQPDGGILIGGPFDQVDGQPHVRLARIALNGATDPGFTPNADQTVHTIALQTDGRLQVGGFFGQLNGQTRSRIGRLNADGSLDMDFNPTASGTVLSLITQPDGRILAGGAFATMSGQPHSRFARLDSEGVVTESLSSAATSVTWLRGGAGPELARATFETTTNGVNWTSLGEGSRISGGWQRTGLSLPPNAVIRARGFVGSSGLQSSSLWFIETITGAPLFVTPPASRTNNANTIATFSVSAIGAPGIVYQWLKNGAVLADGGNISGATNTLLTLSNVFGADAGGYSVVLSNAVGVITSAVATLTVKDPLIIANPQSVATNAGATVTFTVQTLGTEPMDYRWRKEGVELVAPNSATLTLADVQAADATSYDVVVSNVWGSVTSSVATLTLNFAVPDSFNPSASGRVNALAVQADGKILVGGTDTTFQGSAQGRLSRLLPDGTVDVSFVLGPTNSPDVLAGYAGVSGLAVQPDHKILVTGIWLNENRGLYQNLWRLNGDGLWDMSFSNAIVGVTRSVSSVVLNHDGTIWTGGRFTFSSPAVQNLARLLPDGAFDTNFVANVGNLPATLALQPDGKLLIGGSFTTVNASNLNRIARFNTNGTLDGSFNPNANGSVNTIAVQPDGRILLGGDFTSIGGTHRNRLARLNADGTLDTNFNPNVSSTVSTLALQADGRIVLGGSFTNVGGLTRNRLARLNADGSVDTTFNPGANNPVNALAIQTDGGILVGGGRPQAPMTVLGGLARTNIGRLVATDPATQSLDYDGATVTWQQGGSSPVFWRTTFETSPDNQNWTTLGAGTTSSNGWQLGDLALPVNSFIRARGYASGGLGNSSGWFVETITNVSPLIPPWILVPDSVEGAFSFDVFGVLGQTVVVEGSPNLEDWTPLATNMLTVLPFQFTDSGSTNFSWRFYRVRVP